MPKHKVSIQFWSALAMLVGGYALAVAGFITPPKGEISDSVLWIFSQCLIYAGKHLLWTQGHTIIVRGERKGASCA